MASWDAVDDQLPFDAAFRMTFVEQASGNGAGRDNVESDAISCKFQTDSPSHSN